MNAALLVDFLIRKPDSDSLIWPGSPRDLARLRLEQEERDKREATWKVRSGVPHARRERRGGPAALFSTRGVTHHLQVDQRKLIAERRKFIQKNQL